MLPRIKPNIMNIEEQDFKKYCEKILKKYLSKKQKSSNNAIVDPFEVMKKNNLVAQEYFTKGIKLMEKEANRILSDKKDNSELIKTFENIIIEYANKSSLILV